MQLPGEPVDVDGERQLPVCCHQPLETVRENADLPEPLRQFLDGFVRQLEAFPLNLEHAKDDIQVVLHHHAEHVTANRQECRILDCLGGRGARRPAQQRQLAEEVPGTEDGNLLLVTLPFQGQPYPPL
jgi:hypothetical protein